MKMKYGAINIDSDIMTGKPVFEGTNIPVQSFFEYLEDGKSMEKFLSDFPSVNKRHAVEVLQMAKLLLTDAQKLKANFSE